MSQLFDLNTQQKRAVEVEGHALVSACPGSGKTRVLSTRAARLLDSHKSGILVAVTFTKDAAGELKKRIMGQCVKPPGRRLRTGTFHALAYSQLRQAGHKFLILSAGEQMSLLRRAYESTPEVQGMSFEDAAEGIDAIKSSMDPPPSADNPFGILFRVYQDSLQALGRMDFSDLLRHSVLSMRAKDLLPLPACWLLIDEGQDMDSVQYAWVKCHSDAGAEIMVVGDDDQSIYGWRSALGYDGMMTFVKDHRAEHISLTTNYRSRPEIINQAVRLISNNKNRVVKSIHPFQSEQGRVQVVRADSRWGEAQSIVREVQADREDAIWTVLARTNRALDLIEIALRSKQIPCRRVGGKNFWDSTEPAIFLGLLRSLSVDDAVGETMALQWAGVPHAILDPLYDSPPKNGSELIARLQAAHDALPKEDKASRKTLSTFITRHGEWRKAIQLGRIRLAVAGVARWCEGKGAKEKKNPVFSWCEEAISRMSGSIEQRIYYLTQQGKKEQEDRKGVTLMTLHASKGLEFPNVWIIGAETGVLPHADSPVDEERRLFYVGMTRAEERLVVSYITEDATPSRFIAEAGLASQRLG